MTAPWLAILGINEDGALLPEAVALLDQATLVFGGARHLALAAPHIRHAARAWPTPMGDAIPSIVARRGQPTAVLASGDPLWFGIGSMLLRHVALAEARILPAPSSFALAAARLGWALQDTACLSCCGRPVTALVPHLHPGARLLVLSADASTPAAIAALLDRLGHAGSVIRVLEHLGGAAERIRSPVPPNPAALNLVAVEVRGPGIPPEFEHDGQITKPEIRAITLAALSPRPGQVLWDVGAGSGSIGIAWMRHHPACRAIALEPRPDRAARIRRNAETFGVPGLVVVEGRAPEALAGQPPPDAIFLGGGAHRPGVIDAAWAALPPGGRIVANAVTLPTEAALIAAQSRLGGTLLRIGLERLDHVGPMPAYRPAMTVTQWVNEMPICGHDTPTPGPSLISGRGEGGNPLTSSPGLTRGPRAAAGIGCRRGCPPDDIVALVREAEAAAGLRVDALAAPRFKHDEPGLHAAAAALGLPLRFIDDDALAAMQPHCPTRSLAAARATGHASIAEAAALAATGGRLVLPRIANAMATCAIARA